MLLLLQNFVGLSVSDGYIACGSETNEVILTSNPRLSYCQLKITVVGFGYYYDHLKGVDENFFFLVREVSVLPPRKHVTALS